MVWSKGCGKPVVDLRGLNAKVIPDVYPLPYQQDVIGRILSKYWVALLDLQKAFYQMNVRFQDRWKITVITHQGQEVFGVILIEFINSPTHMQKFMD